MSLKKNHKIAEDSCLFEKCLKQDCVDYCRDYSKREDGSAMLKRFLNVFIADV